jgi:hypothetical protein
VEHQNTYSKTGIVLSGAQETPVNSSSGTGTMDVSYSRLSKTLTWSVRWTGLTGAVAAMHIHAIAPSGFAAGVFQNIITNSNGLFTPNATRFGASSSVSGSLFIDGVAAKEADLLNGLLYMNIHTATYLGGEIRGQIKFE